MVLPTIDLGHSKSAVVVVSPFRASPERSRAEHGLFARQLCLRLAKGGFVPFASHLFAPLFLDDDVPEEREAGIAISKGWIERADWLAVWDLWGISTGMAAEIEWAEKMGKAVRYASKGEIPEWHDLTRHSSR
jgi:hypothetical protein